MPIESGDQSVLQRLLHEAEVSAALLGAELDAATPAYRELERRSQWANCWAHQLKGLMNWASSPMTLDAAIDLMSQKKTS